MRSWATIAGQTSANVIGFKFGVVRQDGLDRLSLSQQAQDEFNGNQHATDDRLAAKDARIGGDALQNVVSLIHRTSPGFGAPRLSADTDRWDRYDLIPEVALARRWSADPSSSQVPA